MPYTLNGIGSHYYGKKNVHTHQGICEFCGRTTQINSYDTTEFFVLLFIPIFPLGEKRVIDECSACRRHRVISLKEWKNHLKETIDSLHSNWLLNTNDVETAMELLQSIAYFRDLEKLNSVSRDIRMRCSNNAALMNELGLVHSFFNQFEEAETAFSASLYTEQDNNVRENMAEALSKSLKPDKAKPYLNHITQERITDKFYYIFLLIESYQYIGDHKSALQVIEECENAFPEFKNNKTLRTYRKKSQRNYNSSRRIKGSLITSKSNNKEPQKLQFILPKIIFPAFIVLGLMIYVITAFFLGLSREVYLVNGLNKPYSVEVNGDKIDLQPMSQKMVRLPEGSLKVDILDLNSDEKNLTVEIKTPFWTRPINKPILIINPDKVGVFLWQETQYTVEEQKNLDYEPPYRYYAGQHFYKLDSVNYLFKEFPDTIMMEEGTKRIKSQLLQLNESELNSSLAYILKSLDSENALSYTKARLNYEPDNETNIYAHLSYCDQNGIIDLLKSRLDERPILINWHRTYQNFMENKEPSYDLKGEYTSYLDKEKDNTALYYLLSRIVENPKDAKKLLLKSIEGSDPCPYGYYGLAYQCLSDGNFEDALIYAQKASDALPKQDSFDMVLDDAMLAQGKYDLLLKDNKSQQAVYPLNGDLVAEEILIHMTKGDSTSAKNSISDYLTRIGEYDEETKKMWETYLNGIIAYCTNDVATYATSIEGIEEPKSLFENAFIKGEFDKASQIVSENGFDGSYFLLLYLAQDNPDSASQYLNKAIEAYRSSNKDDQLLADYLSGSKSFGPDEAKSIVILPEAKRIVMTALGKLNPSYQNELYAFAKKLNYDRVFPYHFISKIVENK